MKIELKPTLDKLKRKWVLIGIAVALSLIILGSDSLCG